jgi:hypothetical protein
MSVIGTACGGDAALRGSECARAEVNLLSEHADVEASVKRPRAMWDLFNSSAMSRSILSLIGFSKKMVMTTRRSTTAVWNKLATRSSFGTCKMGPASRPDRVVDQGATGTGSRAAAADTSVFPAKPSRGAERHRS